MNTLAVILPRTKLTQQLLRYTVAGLINTLVGYGIILLLYLGLGLGLGFSNLIGYGVGLMLSFAINRTWTFNDRGSIRRSIILFGALVLVAFTLNLGITFALLRAGIIFPAAQALGIFTYSALVFIGSKYVIFNNRH